MGPSRFLFSLIFTPSCGEPTFMVSLSQMGGRRDFNETLFAWIVAKTGWPKNFYGNLRMWKVEIKYSYWFEIKALNMQVNVRPKCHWIETPTTQWVSVSWVADGVMVCAQLAIFMLHFPALPKDSVTLWCFAKLSSTFTGHGNPEGPVFFYPAVKPVNSMRAAKGRLSSQLWEVSSKGKVVNSGKRNIQMADLHRLLDQENGFHRHH